MPAALSSQAAHSVRTALVSAAEARYRAFGYTKTTMAEIANAAGMSTANIYRYFANKEDLAAACAKRLIDQRKLKLEEAARVPQSFELRLEGFVLAMLHSTYATALEQPQINDLVDTISRKRPDIVHYMNQSEQAILQGILHDANTSSQLAVADIAESAAAVHAAISLFRIPLFMSVYTLEEMETKVRQVVNLAVNGLKTPPTR